MPRRRTRRPRARTARSSATSSVPKRASARRPKPSAAITSPRRPRTGVSTHTSGRCRTAPSRARADAIAFVEGPHEHRPPGEDRLRAASRTRRGPPTGRSTRRAAAAMMAPSRPIRLTADGFLERDERGDLREQLAAGGRRHTAAASVPPCGRAARAPPPRAAPARRRPSARRRASSRRSRW